MPKAVTIILALILCLILARPSLARNNTEGMRELTVFTLMHYGLSLYERGDYDEAANVFNHVLSLDSHQAMAMEYLKEMGFAPLPGFAPIPRRPAAGEFNDPSAVNVDFSDNDSLKQAIAAKAQAIVKLRSQIDQLRARLDAPMVGH